MTGVCHRDLVRHPHPFHSRLHQGNPRVLSPRARVNVVIGTTSGDKEGGVRSEVEGLRVEEGISVMGAGV